MYITRVPNRGSPPAVLLRESFRENGKVKTRTLANLSRWPEHKIDRLDRALKGLPPADWESIRGLRDHPQPAARACGRRTGHRREAGHARADRPHPVAAAQPGVRHADRDGDRAG